MRTEVPFCGDRSGTLAGVNSIRPAAPEDLKPIAVLDSAFTPERRLHLRRLLTERAGNVLVAVDQDRPGSPVIGYVAVVASAFFGRDLVDLLVVDVEHRRHGVGTGLLAAAVGIALTGTVFTSTNESNVAMRSLLEREGWTFSGRLTGLDEDDPELVFYRRR